MLLSSVIAAALFSSTVGTVADPVADQPVPVASLKWHREGSEVHGLVTFVGLPTPTAPYNRYQGWLSNQPSPAPAERVTLELGLANNNQGASSVLVLDGGTTMITYNGEIFWMHTLSDPATSVVSIEVLDAEGELRGTATGQGDWSTEPDQAGYLYLPSLIVPLLVAPPKNPPPAPVPPAPAGSCDPTFSQCEKAAIDLCGGIPKILKFKYTCAGAGTPGASAVCDFECKVN